MENGWNVKQKRLAELLKKKGIGPEGSKSLKLEDVEEVKALLGDDEVAITTKATFLTALLTLSPNPTEKAFIEELKRSPESFLSESLVPFIKNKSAGFLEIVQKVISNTDLSEEECEEGMRLFFDIKEPEYLKASFLEAERLKRETFLENKIFFQALWNQVEHLKIDLPYLIDIGDSYDGCNRTRHFTVFVAALLAAAGHPTYLHGLDEVAPKFGITSHQILKKAGKNPLMGKDQVVRDLVDRSIGWGYLDQSLYFPGLYKLKKMRAEMVKRPFLATFEKLLQPITVPGGNYIVTGYTHTHYREELVKQLKELGNSRKAIVMKGVEGSTQLSMSRETVIIQLDESEIVDTTISPAAFGFSDFAIPRDMNITAEISLTEGVEALQGKAGFAKENIIYTAAVILSKLKLGTPEKIVQHLRDCVDSGKALMHWTKGCLC